MNDITHYLLVWETHVACMTKIVANWQRQGGNPDNQTKKAHIRLPRDKIDEPFVGVVMVNVRLNHRCYMPMTAY